MDKFLRDITVVLVIGLIALVSFAGYTVKPTETKCSTLNFCVGNYVEPNDKAEQYNFDVRGKVIDIEYMPYGNMLVVDTGNGVLQRLHETYFTYRTIQTIKTQEQLNNLSKYFIPVNPETIKVTVTNYSNFSKISPRKVQMSYGTINGSLDPSELKNESKEIYTLVRNNYDSLLEHSYIEDTMISNVILYRSYVRNSTVKNSLVIEGAYDNVTFENTRLVDARIYK